METTQKVLQSMYDKLDNFLKTETVIGEPIVVDNIKLIPIITASFGLGGGIGEENNESGGGGGLGCKISPDAILVIKDNQVEMMPVNTRGSLDKLIEKVPELLEKINSCREKKKQESDIENEE
ncbi:GerW family sporulation protein [Halanaerobium hydrogeniformans]|uniref:Sporulation protein YtfJ n=1 Tax=Halanaerobium hydrogeniformans TaxID=656519 RepID=E4RK40_HALHG|nr:spore germination protein GerW family protein [Halanaerobium hydrogeniformans]ADQ14592.1 Sporulation protein YtfJ [Halanaerobium hydrogeniformans]